MNAPMSAALALSSQDTEALIDNPSLILFDTARMRVLMDFADVMSKAIVTLPKHLHGKPSDCLAVTLQAMRWRMDPYVVAGKTYNVGGVLSYEAQLVVAVLLTSGAVRGRPHYEYKGEGNGLECRAGFVPSDEDDVVWTEWLPISQVKVKNSPLWVTNPRQQMGYLQGRNWARLYAPAALLGVRTPDEIDPTLIDMGDAEEVPRGPRRKSAAATDDVVEATATAAQSTTTPDPATGELVTWPDDAFANQLPRWTKAVAQGLKTVDEILAAARSKGALTPEQERVIRQLRPDPASTPSAADAAITAVQVAYLRNKLKSANVAESTILDRYQITGLELLNAAQFDEIKVNLLAMT